MKFAVIDIETTGNQPKDEIIQIGLVLIEDMEIVERYTTLINPGIGIPSFISELTGITDEMVADAPRMEEVLPIVMSKLQGRVLVAHNAGFDVAFLQKSLEANGYSSFEGRTLDTLQIVRILFPHLASLQLSMVCRQLSIPLARPHQADADAEATAHVWLCCLKRLEELPLLTIQRLAKLFDPNETDLGWFFREIKWRRESFTALDTETYRYYRQFALNVDDWGQDEEETRPDRSEAIIHQPFHDFYDAVKRELRQKFAGYEARTSQEQMVAEVAQSFEEGRHLLVEAGTGTGKSLGYLIPSLYYAIREQKKIVVSTHTVNLQEQLRERDLPLLREVFPVPFRTAVLKGRNHYLCLRKFENKINTEDFYNPQEDRLTASQMIVWLGETERGEDEELHLGAKGSDFWQTVASDAESCLNRACPWFKKCFYHRARHEANEADVIITNHSLLLTDVLADHRLLPYYDHLVIDEAHHFEEAASKHFGMAVHFSSFFNTLQWLYKDNKSGLLPLLRFRLEQTDHAKSESWLQTIDELLFKIVQVRTEWDEFGELLFSLLANRDGLQAETGQLVMRIKRDDLPPNWEKLKVIEDNLYLQLSEIGKSIEQLINDWKEQSENFEIQSLVSDLSGAVKNLFRDRDYLHFFMAMEEESYVYWVEASVYLKSRSLQLHCVPTDVSMMLRQYFFENKESIVMTSATLSVNKSFRYTCEQLGLDPDDPDHVKSVMLPSPFDYRAQSLVVIPRDFPSVRGNVVDMHFILRLADSLCEVALATNGRMLVLFTSYRMLKQVYPLLKEKLANKGVRVIGQGVDSNNRSKLVRQFQDDPASVLLGTSSFWEGVDIPGETLTCLAIVRLPFQPPNHPLVEAKSEILKKNNQNPFMKLSVPQAVIRFKQGFGRLVRSSRDRGVVIVYDTRVIDTEYGKYFLSRMPSSA